MGSFQQKTDLFHPRNSKAMLEIYTYLAKVVLSESEFLLLRILVLIRLHLAIHKHFHNQDWIVKWQVLNKMEKMGELRLRRDIVLIDDLRVR